MKKKTPKISTLKKKLWKIFSLYIRTRDCLITTGSKDWGLCVTCGKRYHIKLLQAGHFISGRHNANLFSQEGTHSQCYNCNITLKGNILEYRRQIIKFYGEGFDEELERKNQQAKQYKVFELEEMIKEYKEKLNGLLH